MESTLSTVSLRPLSTLTVEGQVQRKLASLFPAEEGRRWLDTVQPPLGGSPRELLAGGDGERVLRLLTRLEQGIPT